MPCVWPSEYDSIPEASATVQGFTYEEPKPFKKNKKIHFKLPSYVAHRALVKFSNYVLFIFSN